MRIIVKSVRSGEGFSVLSDVLRVFSTRTSTSYPTIQLLLCRWSWFVPCKEPSTWGIVSMITLLLMAVHEPALLYLLAAALRCRSYMYLVHHWHSCSTGQQQFYSPSLTCHEERWCVWWDRWISLWAQQWIVFSEHVAAGAMWLLYKEQFLYS